MALQFIQGQMRDITYQDVREPKKVLKVELNIEGNKKKIFRRSCSRN